MTRQLQLILYILITLSACKSDKRKMEVLIGRFVINCSNEKYLIEDQESNYKLSFDTIKSTKAFWKYLGYAEQSKWEDTLYPYVQVPLDTFSKFHNLNIPIIGFKDWRSDSRLKLYCSDGDIDTVLLNNFYITFKYNRDTSQAKYKSEISLTFYHDSIGNIENPLKLLAKQYLSYQRERALIVFGKELCNLDVKQLETLKRRVPFRIRLRRVG